MDRVYPKPRESTPEELRRRYLAGGGLNRWWDTTREDLPVFDYEQFKIGNNYYIIDAGHPDRRARFLAHVGRELQIKGLDVLWESFPNVMVRLEQGAREEIERLQDNHILMLDDWCIESVTPRVHRLVFTLLKLRYDNMGTTFIGSSIAKETSDVDTNPWLVQLNNLLRGYIGVNVG